MIPEEGQGKGRILGGLGPLFSGLIAAALIALTLLVAVALGLGEQALTARVEPTATEALAPPAITLMPLPTYTPLPFTDTPVPAADAPPADDQLSSTPTASPTPSPTLAPGKTRVSPTPTRRCVPPNGYPWYQTYRVTWGDSLSYIARATGTTVTDLRLANCMGPREQLIAGSRIYVPRRVVPPPTSTPRPTPTPTIPPPVIEAFTLDPADQVIVGECVQIDWVIEGEVALITLLGDTEVLLYNAPETGSHSDCPTEIGTRTYTLRAVGPDASSQLSKSILVVDESVPPIAGFTGSPTSGEEPLEVSFAAECTGIITSYEWSFGDGGTSAAPNPSHTYAAAGDYTVSLKVTGPGGSDTATKTNYIHVTEPAPPVAAFTGSPTSGEEPLPVVFADGSTGTITSYEWSFGDGGTSTAQNPSHTYAAAGDYTVSLKVTGPGGSDTATRTDYIHVTEPAPPVAAFTGSPTSGEEPLAVVFTDGSTGTITSYEWSFGDGGTSTAQNPSHTYATAGDYTVSLKVTGPGGSDTATRIDYIHVTEPAPPVAAFTGSPTSGEEPLPVVFTDGSTGAVTSYAWSFGDGGTSTAQNPSHTYATAGDYTVSLTVTGPGGSDTATRTSYIHVTEPPPPVAAFSGSPTSGDKPLTVVFTNGSTGTITSYEWSFGDGGTSTAQNPSHTYAAVGDYTVSLKVIGPGGSDTATKTNYISVSEPPPVAAFSGSPTSGDNPLTVVFTNGSTGAITSYAWSFGDGGTSTAQNPSHTYTTAGNYTVSLKVTGPGGSDTATKTNYISVSEPATEATDPRGAPYLLLSSRETAIAALPRMQERPLVT